MARWKARVEFLLSVIERLFTARAMLALQATAIPSFRPSVRHTPVLRQNDGT